MSCSCCCRAAWDRFCLYDESLRFIKNTLRLSFGGGATGIQRTHEQLGTAKTAIGAAECETRICWTRQKYKCTRAGEDHDDESLLADGLFPFAAAFAPWLSNRKKRKRTLNPRWIESFRSDDARARLAAAARLERIGTLFPFVLPI